MARSRIADAYVDIAPALNRTFTRDLQKKINGALQAMSYRPLSRGLQAEGKRGGRLFRNGLETEAEQAKVKLNLKEAQKQAKKIGDKSGKDLRKALEAEVKKSKPDLKQLDSLKAEARKIGRRVGGNFADALESAADDANPSLKGLKNLRSQARLAGRQVGDSFSDAIVIDLTEFDKARTEIRAMARSVKSIISSQIAPALRTIPVEARKAGKGMELHMSSSAKNAATEWKQQMKKIASSTRQAENEVVAIWEVIPTQFALTGRTAGRTFRQKLMSAIGRINFLPGLRSAITRAGQAGASAGKRFADQFTKAIEKLNGPAGKLAGVAGLGFGVKEGLKQSGKAVATEDEAVRLATGVGLRDKGSTDAIKTNIRTIQGWGFDAEVASGITGAIISWNKGALKNQSELEDVSKRLAYINKTYEIDPTVMMKAANRMVENGLAPNAKKALSDMVAGMEQVDVPLREELVELLDEYSPHAGGAGMNSQGFIQMLTNAADRGGAYAMDYTADAIKETKNLVGDLSNTTAAEGLTELGLDPKKMADAFAAGGEESAAAMDLLYRKLAGIPDAADRARISLSVVGTPIEELGRTDSNAMAFFDDYIRRNESFGDSVADMDKSIEKSFTTKAQLLKSLVNELKITWEGVFDPTINTFTPVLKDLLVYIRENREEVQKLMKVLGILGMVFSAIMALGIVGWVLKGIKAFFGIFKVLGPVVGKAKGLFTAFKAAEGGFIALSATGVAMTAALVIAIGIIAGAVAVVVALFVDWDATINFLRTKLGGFGNYLADSAEGWKAAFKGIARYLSESIQGWMAGFSWLGDQIGRLFNNVKGFFARTWDSVGNYLSESVQGWIGAFEWLIEKVEAIAEGIVKAFRWAKEKAKEIWDGGKGAVQDAGGFFNGAVNRAKGFLGIPAMATGGDVIGPQVVLAGEKDPETIVNRGVMNAALRAMLDRLKMDETRHARDNMRMEQQERFVERSQRQLEGRITGAAVRGTVAGVANANAAPIHITINPSQGMNEEQLADAVVNRLAWLQGRQ